MDKVVLLCRVSTSIQSNSRQVAELTEFCKKMNWQIEKVFENKISGAKKNEEREEIVELINYVKEHPISRVVVLEVSRLGRSVLECLKTIQILSENKVSLYIKNYNVETLDENGRPNPIASILTTILLEIAELERSTIRERMESGYNQYREKCRRDGTPMGRPSSYRKSPEQYRQQYKKELSLMRAGMSLRNIQKLTGTAVSTLRKLYPYLH